MSNYEYKVVPAPTKGVKAAGVKGAEGRFAHGLETVMNTLAADGWEYLRADILPSEERQGLTSTQTVYRSVLVFRRRREGDTAAPSGPLPWDAPDSATADEVIDDPKAMADDTAKPACTNAEEHDPHHPPTDDEDAQTRL